jgi:hypothetical protein
MENRFVTHYFTRPKEKSGWVKLTYLTQSNESKKNSAYYMGLSKQHIIEEEQIQKLVKDNILFKVDMPEPITDDQALWLTEKGQIYLANKLNPRGVSNPKKLIAQENLLVSSGQVDVLVDLNNSLISNSVLEFEL